MASRWGRALGIGSFVALLSAVPAGLLGGRSEALAGGAPAVSVPAPDPTSACAALEQGPMTNVFDTRSIGGGPFYVNDHTIVQGPDGGWHLFGIFKKEPMGADDEYDLVHAITDEKNPAAWTSGSFEVAPAPHAIALHVDREAGETHLWAPHVVSATGRYWMLYQGGGRDDYHASIRIAESDDLYRWTRVTRTPAFEDICESRDPMLTHAGGLWTLYYTRCESIGHKVSGVAMRQSSDLAHWTEPRMVLTTTNPFTSNSAYTESPFVFERAGTSYLTVTAYPIAWDATLVYRSPGPLAFPDAPFSRLRGHAAEWVAGRGSDLFITHAGPGQHGVWMSRVTGL